MNLVWEKMRRLSAQWREQKKKKAAWLEAEIEASLKELGYGG